MIFKVSQINILIVTKYTPAKISKYFQLNFNRTRWYPPGHGDFYQAFANSGLLDELIEKEGRSVCFMSNIDNMGATVDLSILHQFIENQNEFIMEVTIVF